MTYFSGPEEMKDAIYAETNVMEFLSVYDDHERLMVDVDDHCPHLADAFRSVIAAADQAFAIHQWVDSANPELGGQR